jgi:hypothetical protein
MTQLSIPAQPAGLYFGVLPNISSDWLAAQNNLVVLMKDGYSFFKANRDVFTGRFADPDKTTTILINHPDTPFIDAITDKDYHKTEESQRNDFMQTVLLIQDIAASIKQSGIEPNAGFLGYDDVATENIFLGDDEAVKKSYPTQSYRGPLEGVMIDARQSDEARAAFNRAAATCTALVNGLKVTVGNEVKQRPAARSLWNYDIPPQFKATDLRR